MNPDNILNEYTEETSLDGQNCAMAQVLDGNTDISSIPVGDGSGWRKVAMGTGFGIVFGTTAGVVTDHAITRKEEQMANVLATSSDETPAEAAEARLAEAEANLHPYVDNEIQIATSVSDGMTFSQAFAAARSEVGSGGAFEWRGNLYNTFTAEEWDNMTPQQHAEYGSHFDWAAYNSTPAHQMAQQASHSNSPAVAHETAQHTEHHDVAATEGHSDDVAVIDSYEPEIEVLGVIHHQEPDLNIGGMLVDGQEVMLVDVDNDGVFDYGVSDLNHDGKLQEDEIVDISDSNVTVEDMGGFTDTNADLYTSDEDAGYFDGSVLV